jgi:hypothetical protein
MKSKIEDAYKTVSNNISGIASQIQGLANMKDAGNGVIGGMTTSIKQVKTANATAGIKDSINAAKAMSSMGIGSIGDLSDISKIEDLSQVGKLGVTSIESPNLNIMNGAGKDRIFQYLQEKYGKECVCYIGTYTEEGIKPAVKDILRTYEVPFKDSNNLCAAFPEDETDWNKIIEHIRTTSPAQYELYNRYKVYLDFVPKLQHFIRSQGCHAGGNIIFNKPVYEYVPVVRNKGEIATAWVENGAETVLDEFAGVIKYDILGLNTLDIIDKCIDNIEEELIEIEDDDGVVKIVPKSYIDEKIIS